MAEHNDTGEYNQRMPKTYTVSNLGNNGYPNKVANTQTQKTRGTGAATRGTGHSKKMG
jgi:hypothetical protein